MLSRVNVLLLLAAAASDLSEVYYRDPVIHQLSQSSRSVQLLLAD